MHKPPDGESTRVLLIHYPDFDEQVNETNKSVSSLVSELRSRNNYHQRLFTANNDRLRHLVNKRVGDKGIEMALNERGKNILWLKLRDNIERSLHINQPTSRKKFDTQPSEARQTYRRTSFLRNNRQDDRC